MSTIKAWYFSNTDKKLRYDDERTIRKGITHKVKGAIEIYGNGLHASERIIDALSYAPNQYVWRVELSGDIVKGDDKIAASERKYLWGFKVSDELLKEFTRECALEVINLWDAPDVVIEYLKTGNESIKAAAYGAAYDAAKAAAYVDWAAYAAARASRAASDATSGAAYAARASSDAASDAVSDAAYVDCATSDAAYVDCAAKHEESLDLFNTRLEEKILAEAKKRGVSNE